ncbi:MAG: leucyl aminopeptidase, partial [Alphaproteobacteria bacterium]|nr:leucyl aminopeptidase [Alphaproteobacteria bacterium]
MQIEFVAADAPLAAGSAVAVLAFDKAVLSPEAARLDTESGGAVTRALGASRFTGAVGQTLDILAPVHLACGRLVVVGAGDLASLDSARLELVAAHAYQAVKTSGATQLEVRLGDVGGAQGAASAAFGLRLASYRFDRYRTTEKPEAKPSVSLVQIACTDPSGAKAAYAALAGLANAVLFARDLVSEPANILYPEAFARRVRELASLGLEVEILGEKEMQALGMGALLGVGQGSVRESQLAVLQWKGGSDPNAPPVAFIGKGVCFDTGGISLKPADGMEEMVTDMGGAAAVTGLMYALAARKAKVNAVGILGLVENMPDGNAQRPGDVVTTLSGQTVEVINTDAEGRLVLADAIWYCKERFKPRFMIDLATLTGAIIVALGKDYAGLFSNNDELADQLLAASKASGEALWRMPLPPQYD